MDQHRNDRSLMHPQDEAEALTTYVLDHYRGLFTQQERLATLSVLANAKAAAYGSPSDEFLRARYVSHDPEVKKLLAEGVPAFRRRLRDRLLSEHASEIHLNRCPKCGALARTPAACLCPACNHTWYELRRNPMT